MLDRIASVGALQMNSNVIAGQIADAGQKHIGQHRPSRSQAGQHLPTKTTAPKLLVRRSPKASAGAEPSGPPGNRGSGIASRRRRRPLTIAGGRFSARFSPRRRRSSSGPDANAPPRHLRDVPASRPINAHGPEGVPGKEPGEGLMARSSKTTRPDRGESATDAADLDHLVKDMAKDPRRAWQTAGDVARQLKWIADVGSQVRARGVHATTPVHPSSGRRNSRERVAWIAAGALAAALVAVPLALGSAEAISIRTPADTHAYRTSILLPDNVDLLSTTAAANRFAVSPDGRRLAFVGAGI